MGEFLNLEWVLTPLGDNLFKICQKWADDHFWFEENVFEGTIVECESWKKMCKLKK
jgi:hypothetical protein